MSAFATHRGVPTRFRRLPGIHRLDLEDTLPTLNDVTWDEAAIHRGLAERRVQPRAAVHERPDWDQRSDAWGIPNGIVGEKRQLLGAGARREIARKVVPLEGSAVAISSVRPSGAMVKVLIAITWPACFMRSSI